MSTITSRDTLQGIDAIDQMRKEIRSLFLLIKSLLHPGKAVRMHFSLFNGWSVVGRITCDMAEVTPLYYGVANGSTSQLTAGHMISVRVVEALWRNLDVIQAMAIQVDPTIEIDLKIYASAARALASQNAK